MQCRVRLDVQVLLSNIAPTRSLRERPVQSEQASLDHTAQHEAVTQPKQVGREGQVYHHIRSAQISALGVGPAHSSRLGELIVHHPVQAHIGLRRADGETAV